MSIWTRLFGGTEPPTREIPGILFVVSKEQVESLQIDATASMVQTVRSLTLSTRRHHVIELSIHGYDQDPRELFEIPEVVRWFQHLLLKIEEVTFWFAPTPLRIALLCMLPESWKRTSAGAIEVEIDPKVVMDKLMLRNVSAAMALAADGLSLEGGQKVAEQAARNMSDAMQGKALGRGYIVQTSSGA